MNELERIDNNRKNYRGILTGLDRKLIYQEEKKRKAG